MTCMTKKFLIMAAVLLGAAGCSSRTVGMAKTIDGGARGSPQTR